MQISTLVDGLHHLARLIARFVEQRSWPLDLKCNSNERDSSILSYGGIAVTLNTLCMALWPFRRSSFDKRRTKDLFASEPTRESPSPTGRHGTRSESYMSSRSLTWTGLAGNKPRSLRLNDYMVQKVLRISGGGLWKLRSSSAAFS